jgi:hypothetical protein
VLRRHLEEEAVKSKSKKEVRTVPYQPERAVPCHPALYGSSAALRPPLSCESVGAFGAFPILPSPSAHGSPPPHVRVRTQPPTGDSPGSRLNRSTLTAALR